MHKESTNKAKVTLGFCSSFNHHTTVAVLYVTTCPSCIPIQPTPFWAPCRKLLSLMMSKVWRSMTFAVCGFGCESACRRPFLVTLLPSMNNCSAKGSLAVNLPLELTLNHPFRMVHDISNKTRQTFQNPFGWRQPND